MSRSSLVEELDRAIDAMLRQPNGKTRRVSPGSEISSLVELAAELRQLPREAFHRRLAVELQPRPLAGLDLRAALAELPDMTERHLGRMNESTIGISRFSGDPRWERHPEGDELLHVLEGEIEVTTLTAGGAVQTTVPAGSFFVCPRGLWHRTRPRPHASLFFVTPARGTERSGGRPHGVAPPGRPRKSSAAVNPQKALRGVPELAISDATTGEEAEAAFPRIGTLNSAGIFAGRFSGLSPWERHSTADELLHILEGEVEITVLTGGGPVRNTVRAGSVFICPRGLWHRQFAAAGVTALSATPQPTDVSFAADPRT